MKSVCRMMSILLLANIININASDGGHDAPLLDAPKVKAPTCSKGAIVATVAVLAGTGLAAGLLIKPLPSDPKPSCIATKPEQLSTNWDTQCNWVSYSHDRSHFWDFGPTCELLDATFPAINATTDGKTTYKFFGGGAFCYRKPDPVKCYNNTQVMRDFPIAYKAWQEGKQCMGSPLGSNASESSSASKLRRRMVRLKDARTGK